MNVNNSFNKVLSYIIPVKKYILVHLEEGKLIIATVQKTHKKMHLTNILHHPLEKTHIIHQRIFNPTFIHNVLEAYIANKNFCLPHLIINTTSVDDHFTLLQHTLCLSKKGFIIDRLISINLIIPTDNTSPHLPQDSCPEQETIFKQFNKLDQFLVPGYHQILPWACMLSLYLIAISFISIFLHQQGILYTKNNNKANQDLSAISKQYQEKVKDLDHLKKQEEMLSKQYAALTAATQKCGNHHKFLTMLAQKLPEQSRLTFLRLGKSPRNYYSNNNYLKNQSNISQLKQSNHPSKDNSFIIKGETHNPDEISAWAKALSEASIQSHFSISRKKASSKQKPTPPTPLHHFVIKGTFIEQKL